MPPGVAHAEMIPQTQGARIAIERGLADQGPQGQTIRELHARPEKVYVTDKPNGILDRIAVAQHGDNLLGLFHQKPGRDYKIFVNEDAHKRLGLSDKDRLETLAHESGHALAQVTGVGGLSAPTGIGALDMFLGSSRLGLEHNESLADALAGIPRNNGRTKPVDDKVALVRQIMKRKVK
jgi:hypothetical protein